jgi:nitrogen-specific signal transduction histidine kinase
MLTGNLKKIIEHGRRADGIVRSMLQHSRGSSEDWQPTDLNALVDEALNLAYHGARAQEQSFNITLERDFDSNLAPVDVVPQELTRVLLNLVANGFYAATSGARRGMTHFAPHSRSQPASSAKSLKSGYVTMASVFRQSTGRSCSSLSSRPSRPARARGLAFPSATRS